MSVVTAVPSPDDTSAPRDFSLRWILMHPVEETARELGHIDLLHDQQRLCAVPAGAGTGTARR